MILSNIFSKKKPTYQTNQVQGSGYGSSYPQPSQLVKNQVKPSTVMSGYASVLKQPAPSRAQATVAAPKMSVAPPRPQMSVAPQKIQGSSATDPRYAGYKPAPAPRPVAPPVQRPQSPQVAGIPSYFEESARRQQEFAEKQRLENENFIKQRTQLSNQQLSESLPIAQEQFNQFKGNTEASIEDLLASGERQKSQTSDYYGEAQRGAAQTLRETRGQDQRTFANLGTLDSRGEGSFQQANENTTSEFNRFTQQNLKAKADSLSEIDASVRLAERNARATITQEEAKMNELARSIQYAIQNNNLQEAQDLTAAFNQSQQYIYDIEDSLAQAKYQFGLAQQELDAELAKVQSFTPEFMATGQPTNQAEYEFFVKNKDSMSGLYGGDTNSKDKAIKIIDDLAKVNTSGITGKMRYGYSDESRAAEGLLKQLSSELQIEEARRLKGQGAMSDAERSILANSIAAFNLDENGRPNISDDRFKQILGELRSGFSGSTSGGQTIRVINNMTGQTGTIPIGEFNPQEYTQI